MKDDCEYRPVEDRTGRGGDNNPSSSSSPSSSSCSSLTPTTSPLELGPANPTPSSSCFPSWGSTRTFFLEGRTRTSPDLGLLRLRVKISGACVPSVQYVSLRGAKYRERQRRRGAYGRINPPQPTFPRLRFSPRHLTGSPTTQRHLSVLCQPAKKENVTTDVDKSRVEGEGVSDAVLRKPSGKREGKGSGLLFSIALKRAVGPEGRVVRTLHPLPSGEKYGCARWMES